MSTVVNISERQVYRKRRDKQILQFSGASTESVGNIPSIISLLDNYLEVVDPGTVDEYLRVKLPIGCDYDIQAFTDSGQLPPGIWESLPIASATVLGVFMVGSGLVMTDGVLSVAAGGGMVYPGNGIAVSTGAAWGASITDNSANWNTAYGWGNHASAGYAAGSHNHTGVYDPAGTASSAISSHESAYAHADIAHGEAAFGWGSHASAGYAVKANDETINGGWTFHGATAYPGGPCAIKVDNGDIWLVDGKWLTFGSDADSWIDWGIAIHNSKQGMRFWVENYDDDHVMEFGGRDAAGTIVTMMVLHPRTACELYYAGAKKMETTSTGMTVTGAITADGGNSAQWNSAYSWGDHASAGYAAGSHNHTGVYDPAGTGHTEAAAHVSAHELTYNHANYNTAYDHSQDNSQAHSDYLINNGDDTTSGVLTAAGFATTNFKIEQSGSDLVIKYGSTVIAKVSSAGVIQAADNIQGGVTF